MSQEPGSNEAFVPQARAGVQQKRGHHAAVTAFLDRISSLYQGHFERIENFGYHYKEAERALQEMHHYVAGSTAYNQYRKLITSHVYKASRSIEYLRRQSKAEEADEAKSHLDSFVQKLIDDHDFHLTDHA